MSPIGKTKGRLTLNSTASGLISTSPMITAVEAAATVPASSTETNASFTIFELNRSRVPLVPEQSADMESSAAISSAARARPGPKSDLNSNIDGLAEG